MKKLVVSTGAGISAESGLSTFRDADGLWDKYPVMQVASAAGFRQNPALIHQFRAFLELLILQLLRDQGSKGAQASDFNDLFKTLSRNQIYPLLKELRDIGQITSRGRGKSACWFLAEHSNA